MDKKKRMNAHKKFKQIKIKCNSLIRLREFFVVIFHYKTVEWLFRNIAIVQYPSVAPFTAGNSSSFSVTAFTSK